MIGRLFLLFFGTSEFHLADIAGSCFVIAIEVGDKLTAETFGNMKAEMMKQIFLGANNKSAFDSGGNLLVSLPQHTITIKVVSQFVITIQMSEQIKSVFQRYPISTTDNIILQYFAGRDL